MYTKHFRQDQRDIPTFRFTDPLMVHINPHLEYYAGDGCIYPLARSTRHRLRWKLAMLLETALDNGFVTSNVYCLLDDGALETGVHAEKYPKTLVRADFTVWYTVVLSGTDTCIRTSI